MALSPKTVVAVYPRHYLTVSMTFIYRQLLGVGDSFEPIVLAGSTDNLDLFPFPAIYSKQRRLIDRVYCKVVKTVAGKSELLSPLQTNYWRQVLLEKKVRLLHVHFGPAGLEMLPLVKSLNLPLLVTFHGYDASIMLRDRKYVSDLRELFDYAHIITVSEFMAKRLYEFGANPERTHVHYIGVPVDDFRFVFRTPLSTKRANSEQIRFLQVSNFVEKKGHSYTVLAFRDFLTHYPNSTLTLAGDGPLANGIRDLCVELGILDKVHFVGKVAKPEVMKLMGDCDIFLHHSVTDASGNQEGIPTVLMEAMATGLVVVSTFHSGIPELIEDGRNGYLVPERDVLRYAEKMVSALESPPELPLEAANSIRDRFNIVKQNLRLKEIYRAVMAAWQ